MGGKLFMPEEKWSHIPRQRTFQEMPPTRRLHRFRYNHERYPIYWSGINCPWPFVTYQVAFPSLVSGVGIPDAHPRPSHPPSPHPSTTKQLPMEQLIIHVARPYSNIPITLMWGFISQAARRTGMLRWHKQLLSMKAFTGPLQEWSPITDKAFPLSSLADPWPLYRLFPARHRASIAALFPHPSITLLNTPPMVLEAVNGVSGQRTWEMTPNQFITAARQSWFASRRSENLVVVDSELGILTDEDAPAWWWSSGSVRLRRNKGNGTYRNDFGRDPWLVPALLLQPCDRTKIVTICWALEDSGQSCRHCNNS